MLQKNGGGGGKNGIKGKGEVVLIFSKVVREGLMGKPVTTKSEGGKGVSHVDIAGKSVLGRGNSQCLTAEVHLTCSRNRKDTSMSRRGCTK